MHFLFSIILLFDEKLVRAFFKTDFLLSSSFCVVIVFHYVFEGSRVICWGANDKGQLGYGDTSDEDNPRDLSFLDLRGDGRISKIYAGGAHTCVVFDPNGRVKCWGKCAHACVFAQS